MHEFVSFNQCIIPSSDSFISATSAAALYGKGIFTTLAIYNSKPFQWEKHWRRLTKNAQKIGVDLSKISKQTIEQLLSEIISANKIVNGRARLTVLDESTSRIWQTSQRRKTSFLIQTADFRPVSESFCLAVSPFAVNSKSPLTGVKSCNYLENILVLDDAKAKGFDEAIRVNERGAIVSAAMANVFWIKGARIFTPSLNTGCLEGTTRAVFLENFAVNEIEAQIKTLMEADAVFLTSAGIEIVEVKSINGQEFPASSDAIGKLQNFFRNLSEKS
ncbi:MAG: aminotransferase class IV [Acidobacteriota bacterium]|nr:aminotransferase class IV [Acidobacteriota bacterium]